MRAVGAHRRADGAGQAVPLVLGAVALLAVILVGIGWFGRSLVDAATARTAADAAALAGVVAGRSAAATAARANGGELVEFSQLGSDVVVVVRVGRATASARAGLGDGDAYTRSAWPRSIDRLTRSTARRLQE